MVVKGPGVLQMLALIRDRRVFVRLELVDDTGVRVWIHLHQEEHANSTTIAVEMRFAWEGSAVISA